VERDAAFAEAPDVQREKVELVCNTRPKVSQQNAAVEMEDIAAEQRPVLELGLEA